MNPFEMQPDWPPSIKKPPLPEGYEWVCLRQALGVKIEDKNPWYIRVRETRFRGRLVKVEREYFVFPQNAIKAAIQQVKDHKKRKQK